MANVAVSLENTNRMEPAYKLMLLARQANTMMVKTTAWLVDTSALSVRNTREPALHVKTA